MSEIEGRKLRWHRVKLLALMGVFLLPFIAGWLAFYVFDYRPQSKNYGELIAPPRPLDAPQLRTIDGEVLDRGFWARWTFVVIDRNGCAQLCRDNLHYLRQLRIALGRDQSRVQNLALFTTPVDDDLLDYLKDFSNLKVVASNVSKLLPQFALPGVETGREPMLYLVDPKGNLMMTYPAEHDPSLVLDDLRRLLKVSQIG